MIWNPAPNEPQDLAGLEVLVVDDESVIALELECILSDAGAMVVGPACNVDEALALVRDHRISAAVLDVRLAGQTIAPVAQALADRDVPFVFYSGQVEDDPLLHRWPFSSFVAKPAPARVLVRAVRSLTTTEPAAR